MWPHGECFESHSLYKKGKLCAHVANLVVVVEDNSAMAFCYVDLQTALEHLLLDADFAENAISGSHEHQVMVGLFVSKT